MKEYYQKIVNNPKCWLRFAGFLNAFLGKKSKTGFLVHFFFNLWITLNKKITDVAEYATDENAIAN